VSRSYGETWVYESLVGGIPGLTVSRTLAVALQFVIFEVGVLALGWYYGLWNAVLAGTAAVVVAAVGSVEMHRLGAKNRLLSTPPAHKRLLFGSSIEIVLGVLAFIALVTYLLAWDGTLLDQLFGVNPPVPVVYLTLLVLWDLTYRIGTSWWSAVVALWRAVHITLPADEALTDGLRNQKSPPVALLALDFLELIEQCLRRIPGVVRKRPGVLGSLSVEVSINDARLLLSTLVFGFIVGTHRHGIPSLCDS